MLLFGGESADKSQTQEHLSRFTASFVIKLLSFESICCIAYILINCKPMISSNSIVLLIMLITNSFSSLLPKLPYLLRKNMSGRQANAVRVVTDIDDTVKSSGGVKLFGIALGGIDVRLC